MVPSSLEIIAGIDEVDQETVDSVGPQAIDESEQPHIFTFVEQLLGDFDCHGPGEAISSGEVRTHRLNCSYF